jgi:hypothetical protein
MSLRPTQGDEKRTPQQPLSIDGRPFLCHPERTRISYFTTLTGATYVVLPKENHMQLTEAATLHRKSGEAEGSAVPRTFPGNAESHPATELSSRPERSEVERSAVSFSGSHTPSSPLRYVFPMVRGGLR